MSSVCRAGEFEGDVSSLIHITLYGSTVYIGTAQGVSLFYHKEIPLSVNSTSTNIKVKITIKINRY